MMLTPEGTNIVVDVSAAAGAATAQENWPPEVELILSALEAAGNAHDNRRQHPRMSYRTIAELRLFSDQSGTPAWRLYTRDVSARGVGFITPHRLPLGYGGVIQLPTPRTGRMVSVNGTLFRCREISDGWFEGAMYFNREQWVFAPQQQAS
jgi:hypothetical protein